MLFHTMQKVLSCKKEVLNKAFNTDLLMKFLGVIGLFFRLLKVFYAWSGIHSVIDGDMNFQNSKVKKVASYLFRAVT